MFGIGVIAATGWCHLIPDAFEKFSSPCLTGVWADYGPAFVGVFALAATFLVQIIELSAGGKGHSHGPSMPDLSRDELSNPNPSLPDTVREIPIGHSLELLRLETVSHEKGKYLSTVILEAGILFHSIIIGLSLGVTADLDTFKTLLIAICFHQFFEGLALGALIAKLNQKSIVKFLVMGLIYPLTTPIGMSIGIGVRNQYNENSQGTILSEGILNSLSLSSSSVMIDSDSLNGV